MWFKKNMTFFTVMILLLFLLAALKFSLILGLLICSRIL